MTPCALGVAQEEPGLWTTAPHQWGGGPERSQVALGHGHRGTVRSVEGKRGGERKWVPGQFRERGPRSPASSPDPRPQGWPSSSTSGSVGHNLLRGSQASLKVGRERATETLRHMSHLPRHGTGP